MTNRKFEDQEKGLYQSDYEHDACGVGMVVNIHGNKSHELVEKALHVLENMRHRGAEVGNAGDGAGIMVQIPHEFILLQGIPVPEKGKYGTGLVFLPKDERAQQEILSVMIDEIEREGLQLMHLRTVPTNPDSLGASALSTEPSIKQVFITGVSDDAIDSFPRTLYIIRKKIERRIHNKDFYICSLSNKNIVYKGMLSSIQVRQFIPTLPIPISRVVWHWSIPDSAQTPSPLGHSPSLSVCWPTMVKSTPSAATEDGCKPVRAYCWKAAKTPHRQANSPRTFRPLCSPACQTPPLSTTCWNSLS